jgi:hypothetical protein
MVTHDDEKLIRAVLKFLDKQMDSIDLVHLVQDYYFGYIFSYLHGKTLELSVDAMDLTTEMISRLEELDAKKQVTVMNTFLL